MLKQLFKLKGPLPSSLMLHSLLTLGQIVDISKHFLELSTVNESAAHKVISHIPCFFELIFREDVCGGVEGKCIHRSSKEMFGIVLRSKRNTTGAHHVVIFLE